MSASAPTSEVTANKEARREARRKKRAERGESEMSPTSEARQRERDVTQTAAAQRAATNIPTRRAMLEVTNC